MPRRPVRLRASAMVVVMAALAEPAAAEPTLSVLPLPFAVTQFRGPGSRVSQTAGSTATYREERALGGQPLVVLWGPGGGAAVAVVGGELQVLPARRGPGDMSRLEQGRTAIPGARQQAEGPITVTLEEPTRAYPHEALGSPTHAGSLVVSERRPGPLGAEPRAVPVVTSRVPAGPDAVFEDREPRLADLDGDGVPEILLVRSRADRGSALAIVGRREGAWAILAETPPDGEPFRWLNPAGIAPAGAGRGPRPIALVRRPHLDGVLQLWVWTGAALILAGEKSGYANHAFGEAAQDLAAVLPGPDGRPRLALPTLDRRALAILSFDATLAEHARIPLPARASTGVAALGTGSATRLLVGLEDGRVVEIRP